MAPEIWEAASHRSWLRSECRYFSADQNLKSAEAGKEKIAVLLEEAVDRKIFSPDEVEDILARVTPVGDFSKLKDAALVIEAVFEDKKAKISLFRELDSICCAETIFATNTSSLSVSELGAESGRADRFGGLHFFYHPAKNRLLEVIAGERHFSSNREPALGVCEAGTKSCDSNNRSRRFCG